MKIVACWFITISNFLESHSGAITAAATVFIAGFTIALARSTKKLWKEATSASEIAKRTADAATIAANAAKKSADLAERSLTNLERPYVFVNNVWDFDIGPRTDTDGKSEYFPSIKYSVSNHGRLPAIIDNICAAIIHAPDERLEMPLGISNSDPLLTDRFIEVNGWRQGLIFNESTLDAATVNRADLTNHEIFFWIIIYYHGPLTKDHESSFCWRMSFEQTDKFTLIPYGNETYNYTK